MKLFRISAWLLCVLALSVQFVVAQAATGDNQAEMKAKLEKLSAELQLTPPQKVQMLEVLKQEAPKMQEAKNDTSSRPLEKARKMKAIGADTDAKVKTFLNPAQYQKWEAIRAQQREEMMQKMQGGR